ncbi:MAG: AAA family ATPase, partial [bacterium]|nr:AAA family ATPase [bacterium]
LLSGHETIASEIVQKIRPLAYFKDYLKAGYYPFFKEVPILYPQRLTEVVNLILEIELPQLRRVDIAWIHKLRQLLLIIAESAPFKPNISALSNKIGINRETLLAYLHHLSECGLTRHLYREGKGISRLQKPDKVYLDNTNLAYTLRPSQPDTGTIRATYFANQLAYQHKLSYPKTGDFLVDGQHLFEIGGPGKSGRQLPDTSGFLALDNIEFGYQNRIPLWLFGFLY